MSNVVQNIGRAVRSAVKSVGEAIGIGGGGGGGGGGGSTSPPPAPSPGPSATSLAAEQKEQERKQRAQRAAVSRNPLQFAGTGAFGVAGRRFGGLLQLIRTLGR